MASDPDSPTPAEIDEAVALLGELEARLEAAVREADATWEKLAARAAALRSAIDGQMKALAAEAPVWSELELLATLLADLGTTPEALAHEAKGDDVDGERTTALAPILALGLEAGQEVAARLRAKSADIQDALAGAFDRSHDLVHQTASEVEAFGEETYEKLLALLDMIEGECYPLLAEAARAHTERLAAARLTVAEAHGVDDAAGSDEDHLGELLLKELERTASGLESLTSAIRALLRGGRAGFESEREGLARGGREVVTRLQTVLKAVGEVEELVRR